MSNQNNQLSNRIKKLETELEECKQTIKKISKNEEKYRTFFESSTDAILLLDPKHGYLDCNNAALELFSIPNKDELKKLSPVELSPKYQPGKVLSKELAKTNMKKTMDEGSYMFEWTHKKLDGEEFISIVVSAKIELEGKVLLQGNIRDITKRKHIEEKLHASEEKWNALFGAMTEMVVLHEVVFNSKGEAINYRITDCNKAYTEITGIKKEYAAGKLATEVYQVEPAPYLHEFCNVGITGEPFEYSTYYAPMDKHFLISVVSPQKGKFATITTDITDIKQIEEMVSAKNQELENYLYVASHDLRSPLVNIQGFSQILKEHTNSIQDLVKDIPLNEVKEQDLDTIFNEEIPKTLDFINTNVAKMDNLIKGLLQISRTGRVAMTIKEIDMNILIKKVIEAHQYQIDEAGINVTVSDLPICFGDFDLLNQLFSNIFGNAIKYRHEDKKLAITIKAKTKYNQIVYSIKDNGIGISSRHLERIWDVFFQVNPKLTDSGDGIGLSIVKRIADKHKGKVRVESEEGVGSTFYIELQKNIFTE